MRRQLSTILPLTLLLVMAHAQMNTEQQRAKPATPEWNTTDTLYFDRQDISHYDTIPFMVKDQAFLDGLNELTLMLKGNRPYSLKKAEFIVEWAYSGGVMDYSRFSHDIDSVVDIFKRFL